MIINALNYVDRVMPHMALTMINALANEMRKMKVGDSLYVESLLDVTGKHAPVDRIRMLMRKISEERKSVTGKFATRKKDQGLMIIRIM